MNLVKELQNDILDPEISLSSVLRKAKVLASTLGNEDFKKWVDNELNGYQKSNERIPDYRRIYPQSFGHFLGPVGVKYENIPIPTLNMPENIKKFVEEFPVDQGIRALESLVESDESFSVPWPANIIALVSNNIYKELSCISARKVVDKNVIEQILDTVRNRLLNFILELQEMYPGINSSEDAIPGISKEEVSSVFNTLIIGNQNIVAAGSQIDQNILQQIVKNDINTLLDYMTQIGIPDNEVQDLRRAIESDGPRTEPNKFGSKVAEWVGNATKDALKGTYKIAASTASKLIIEALLRYYG